MTTLQEDALTQTFKDVERMIDMLCWKFKKRHGGEFDDWKSVGCIAFMKAYESWTPTLSSFSTWCYNWVWGYLKHHERKEYRTYSRTVYSSPLVNKMLGEESEEVEESELVLI